MKILILFVILTSALAAAEPNSMLKVECKSVESDTGTQWHQQAVTYSLDGFAPLTIEADAERGVYPSGAKEIHKLADARFLTFGGYSTGGGMYTTVLTIIAGRNGRLLIEDELEFTRDRRRYEDKVLSSEGSFSVAFPPLPAPEVEVHALYAWQLELRGTRYDSDTIRTFLLTKPPSEKSEMIVFQIDDKGFVLPMMKKAEQVVTPNGP
jgi:hypothetical protein